MRVQALEDNPNALQYLSDDLREKLLQTLLERRLKQFTSDVRTLCLIDFLPVPMGKQHWLCRSVAM